MAAGSFDLDVWALIAERKILEAMEEGKFDGLSCRGRPLPEEDFTGIPPERRLGMKLLRNAGVLPPEMQLRKEIALLRTALESAPPGGKAKLAKEIEYKTIQYNVMMERRC